MSALAFGGVVALDVQQDIAQQDTDSDVGTQQSTHLRVVHASPDAPAVDVTIDNETVVSDVEFGDVSDYLSLEAGTYNVTIAAADDPDTILFDEEVTFEPRTVTTVAATGEITEDAETSFQPVAFEDDAFTPADNESALSVVHLAPDAPVVDVTAEDGSVVLADNVSYQNGSDYVTVPPGDYTLEIREEANDNSGEVLTTGDLSLENGTAHSAFAVGYLNADEAPADTPFEVVLSEDATLTVELPSDEAMDGDAETDDGTESDDETDGDDDVNSVDGDAGDGDADDGDVDGDDSAEDDSAAEGSSDGSNARTIDQCTTIQESGTYELTGDISDSSADVCLSIEASDVTIEGNGQAIEGGGVDQSVGVRIYDPDGGAIDGITVQDLTVTNWFNGVQVGSSPTIVPPDAPAAASLQNVEASSNEYHGIYIASGGDTQLSSVTANGNGESGVGIFDTSGVEASGLTVTDNGEHGLVLFEAVFNGQYSGVTSTGNGGAGVYIGIESTGNQFSDLTVEDNDGPPIEGYDGSDNTIDDPPEETDETGDEMDDESPDENEGEEEESPGGNESADDAGEPDDENDDEAEAGDEPEVDDGNETDGDDGDETGAGDGVDDGDETDGGSETDDGDEADDGDETDAGDGTDDGDVADGGDEADAGDGTGGGDETDEGDEADGGSETDDGNVSS